MKQPSLYYLQLQNIKNGGGETIRCDEVGTEQNHVNQGVYLLPRDFAYVPILPFIHQTPYHPSTALTKPNYNKIPSTTTRYRGITWIKNFEGDLVLRIWR
ncbi:hypothetical protein SAMD00079811_73430 [Scytonema sp. HK-05]|uniref:hypothetical protein n=1 Tax=Scytonema sp. HK-05 TaxID=1137095 RepID=UPI000937B3CA|nr:hypothetical protein [Scytonema sp. HK-05]OKH52882.1 hypothetical protein NIES2130_31250 [Scytonema sp. HK-05]BAY49714.1 hypothetical protein SAMD00079811_73430 [Scytonema sp. HK-05]